jgi:hypothetical protein
MASLLSTARTAVRTAEAAAKIGDVVTAREALAMAQAALSEANDAAKAIPFSGILGPYMTAVRLVDRLASARDRTFYAVERAERRAARNAR